MLALLVAYLIELDVHFLQTQRVCGHKSVLIKANCILCSRNFFLWAFFNEIFTVAKNLLKKCKN